MEKREARPCWPLTARRKQHALHWTQGSDVQSSTQQIISQLRRPRVSGEQRSLGSDGMASLASERRAFAHKINRSVQTGVDVFVCGGESSKVAGCPRCASLGRAVC